VADRSSFRQRLRPRSTFEKLSAVFVVEVCYAVVTRVLVRPHFDPIPAELYVTGCRLLTLPIYWALFSETVRSRSLQWRMLRRPLFGLGLAMSLLTPVLVDDLALPSASAKLVFVLTSPVVGLREEVVYRGIVQNSLERPLGWIGAIAVTSLLFSAYHVGGGAFGPVHFFIFFLAGGALGVMYRGSGSLWLVIGVHSLYDALSALSPIFGAPLLGLPWAVGFELGALLMLVIWAGPAIATHRGLATVPTIRIR
jgi:membrane protease YdiL (CAAX protease family)